MIARGKGLEPLAELLFAQAVHTRVQEEAAKFIDEEKGVASAEDALAGARDIIAEQINEDQATRDRIRKLFAAKGVITSKVLASKKDEAGQFEDYFDRSESVSTAPSHRVLAMWRGEREGFLMLCVLPDEDESLGILESMFVTGDGQASEQVRLAMRDGYKRLLSLSMETEIRVKTKQRADAAAIKVFAENLRELLLPSALEQKNVLAMDPGYRTGCKVVCLDRQGKLLCDDVVYVTQSERQAADAEAKILA